MGKCASLRRFKNGWKTSGSLDLRDTQITKIPAKLRSKVIK